MKECLFCEQTKPLSEFYVFGGRKCKACTRKAVAERVKKKKESDLNWVLKERERCRQKTLRYRLAGKVFKHSAETTRRYRERHPEKYNAHSMVAAALESGTLKKQPCEACGASRASAHHDDYSKPLDVRWLCAKHHADHHRKEREEKLKQKFQTQTT